MADNAPRRRPSIIPLARGDDGALELTTPQIIQDVLDAFTAPKRAYTGELQVWNPETGHTTDEARGAASGMVGMMMTGGLPAAQTNALGTFGGRMAASADRAGLQRAYEMRSAKAPPEQILNETGWFRGVDGMPRFEISDDAARITPGRPQTEQAQHLGDVLAHPELYKAYPDLAQAKVYDDPRFGQEAFALRNSIGFDSTQPNAREIALHEIQHLIQKREQFSPGTNPEVSGRASYRNAAGEVEARNVEARSAMTPEERRAVPPWNTQDVPAPLQRFVEDQQAARSGSGLGAMFVKPERIR